MNDVVISEQQVEEVDVIGKTFGNRAWAYIIDSVAYVLSNSAVSFATGVAVGIVLNLTGREYQFVDEQSMIWIDQIVGLFLFALYFAIFEWLFGATLGKLVLGMRVVMENGDSCSLGGALIRAFFRYIDGLLFAIPAYYTMKHPLYQRIGDKSAKTIVIAAKDTFIKQPRDWWWFLIAAGVYLTVNVVITLFLIFISIR